MRPGKMMRSSLRQQMGKAMGDVEADDTELRSFQRAQEGAVAQSLNAQQTQLNRQAMAAAGGGPVQTGQFAEASRQLGDSAADKAIEAAGEQEAFKNALRTQRRAEGIQASQALRQMNRERAGDWMKGLSSGLSAATSGARLALNLLK